MMLDRVRRKLRVLYEEVRLFAVQKAPALAEPKAVRASIILLSALGILAGVGGFTFHYAKGTSYFTSDPKYCMNCHIMREQYETWERSSHHAVARCVDCHLPHSFIPKWIAKAENGYHHSKAFTFQDFHEPIMIKPKNARILEASCLECHADITHSMRAFRNQNQKDISCVKCHASVGHGAPY
jgi:cytochrome c nitrite reductase small subunit